MSGAKWLGWWIQVLLGHLAGRMSDRVKTFSFAEIVRDRDAAVRITDDGYFYAVDLSMVMTGADRNYAAQVFS